MPSLWYLCDCFLSKVSVALSCSRTLSELNSLDLIENSLDSSSCTFCQSSVWLWGVIMKVTALQQPKPDILLVCETMVWILVFLLSSSPSSGPILSPSYQPNQRCCFLFSKRRWSWMHNAFYLFLSLFSLPRVFPVHSHFISSFPVSGECALRWLYAERSHQLCLVTELSTFLQTEAGWPLPSRHSADGNMAGEQAGASSLLLSLLCSFIDDSLIKPM